MTYAAPSLIAMLRDYLELTKPRITLLILICTAVGYWFGCRASFHWTILAHALLGTALLASGTSALNQWYEMESDGKMRRTRQRPLPAGRIKRRNGLVFGLLLSAAGFADLWIGSNFLAAALGLFTLLSYLLLYTPMKQRSSACTIVGAIPGAMPPLIGYAAAAHRIDPSALALFLILFVWQFPHFDAIAWMYRDDYARGGIRMLPVIDPHGESTARRVVVCSLLLIPISLVPLFLGMTGALYAAAAIATGLGVLYFGVQMGRERTLRSAKALLLATVLYLPTLLGVMLLDRTSSVWFASSNASITTTSPHWAAVDSIKESRLAGERITAKLTRAPGNDAPIGGLKLVTASGWCAARPSGTEDIYKTYAESFQGGAHLNSIVSETQEIVDRALESAT